MGLRFRCRRVVNNDTPNLRRKNHTREQDQHASGVHSETAVLAGGCFWGVPGVFQHLRGVTQVASGYTGGAANTAEYERVSDGDTRHAELQAPRCRQRCSRHDVQFAVTVTLQLCACPVDAIEQLQPAGESLPEKLTFSSSVLQRQANELFQNTHFRVVAGNKHTIRQGMEVGLSEAMLEQVGLLGLVVYSIHHQISHP
jgi:hypothetical protein